LDAPSAATEADDGELSPNAIVTLQGRVQEDLAEGQPVFAGAVASSQVDTPSFAAAVQRAGGYLNIGESARAERATAEGAKLGAAFVAIAVRVRNPERAGLQSNR